MTSTVDNRIVELGFNNKEFERGTEQSLKSIDSLKKGLNFDESAKSISNLSKVSGKFSLASMGEGVDSVARRFSTFGIIGMTVLQNLTNAAINYGRRMINSFMTPMKTGFQEYETQMNAIQTVLANTESKGTTLKDVSAALDELNTYADKTIYNFTEMTRNIGTFTAAGVELDTSVAAIKGIANLAAVSGSNSQQASTAMYQLSQALSSGTVKLMDWNSVVNAGMGGQVFQDALKETARVSGIAIDDLIAKHGSFRETLSEGWLSSEVLLDTLKKFTGDLSAEQLKTMGYNEEQIAGILKLGQTANDAATKVKTFTQLQDTLKEAMQSGWTRSWQIIIGDFEQAKALFTEISDTLGAMIGASADARNAFLEDWAGMGGRTAAIQTLRNIFQGLLTILAPIKEAFREIFPPKTAGDLFKLTLIIRNLSERLILTSESADKVKRIFLGLFSILGIAKDIVVSFVTAFFDLSKEIPVTGDGILEFLARIGDFLVGMREGIDVTGAFENAVTRIKDIIQTISRYVEIAKEAFLGWKESIQETFSGIFEKIDLSGIKSFFGKFQTRLTPFESLIKGIGIVIGAMLKGAERLVPGLFTVGKAIFEFVSNIGKRVVQGFSNINFSEVFDTINAGLIGAILLAIRNFINSGSGVFDELGGIFGGLTGILDGVRGSFEAWQQNLKAKTLMNIAIAIGILAASLLVISTIDSEKLTKSMGILTGMFIQLIGAQAAYGKLGGAGPKAATSLILMATALLILSVSISKLAKLDKKAMQDALSIMYGLLAGMLVFSKLMSKNQSNLIKAGIGMTAVAISMLFLAQVVKKLGEFKPEVLAQGLKGIGIMLAEIAIFIRIIDNKGVSKALGLLALAGAIVILANVVEKLGSLDVGTLQKGLISIAAVLGSIALFIKISGSGKGLISTSIGVTILAGALEIFVDVVKKLGNMKTSELAKGLGGMAIALIIIAGAMRALPKNIVLQSLGLLIVAGALEIISKAIKRMGGSSWKQIAKGLVTLAGALAIITVALYSMTGTLAGSAALLVAAGALAILTPVLQTLGSMQLSEIGFALLALAGVFVVLGAAGILLTPLVPTLLGLGGALFLLGAGTALVGVGLLAFSTGLLALSVGGSAAALGIVAFVTTLLGLLPVIAKALVDTLVVFAKGIQEAAPEIAKAVIALMNGFLDVIIKTSPKIFKTLDVLLKGLIQLIVDNTPNFVTAIVGLALKLLQEIAAKVPDFVQAGFDILIGFLEGIRDNIGEVVTTAIDIVTEFLDAVAEKLPDIIESGFNLIIAFIDGMADSIEQNSGRLLESVGNLAVSIIEGLVTGITNGVKAVMDAIVALIKRVLGAAWDAFKSDSPSQEMIDLAETVPEGLAAGIAKYGYKAVNAMKDFGKDVIDTMGIITSAASNLIDGEFDINPTITPVVDMSEITSANDLLGNMFGITPFNILPTIAKSASIAGGLEAQTSKAVGDVINEGSTITFNQTNNSPEALSRLEIYRQTRNQLLLLSEEMVP